MILSVSKYFMPALSHWQGVEWPTEHRVYILMILLSFRALGLQEETFQGHVARIGLVIWGPSVIRIYFKN